MVMKLKPSKPPTSSQAASEPSPGARKTLARKWLKTPHNRFKMRHRRPRPRIHQEEQAEMHHCHMKEKLRQLEVESYNGASKYLVQIRSHTTATTGVICNREEIEKLGHHQEPAINNMSKLKLLSLILIGIHLICFPCFAKMVTSQAASQVESFSEAATTTTQMSATSTHGTSMASQQASTTINNPTGSTKTKTTTSQLMAATSPSPISPRMSDASPSPNYNIKSPWAPVRHGPRLEEEVSLISGDSSLDNPRNNSNRVHGRRQRQKPHLFRIQTALNGKLMGPARVESPDGSDGAQHSSPVMSATEDSEIESTTSQAEWRPSAAGRPFSDAQSVEATTSQVAPLQEQDGEPCTQPEVEQTEIQQASIDASSQILKLTSATGSRAPLRQMLSSGGPETGPKLDWQQQAVAAAATAVTQPIDQPPTSQQQHQLAVMLNPRASHQTSQQVPQARMSLAAMDSSPGADQQQQRRHSNANLGAESILSLIDEYDSKIITNRTKAQLSCDSGEMVLRLNFSDSFKGIVYPDHNRLSPCRFFGDGHHNYELRLPLRGCGTRQAAPRVFVNDVIVRFHKTLELEEDEVKTLICRYPPPLAPEPLPESPTHNPAIVGSNRHHSQTIANPQGTNGVIEQEGPAQFEFVDSLDGRPKLPEPGNSGNIETLSENLIVAPAGGAQQHQQQPGGSSDHEASVYQRPGLRQREQPAGRDPMMNPRNSLLLDPSTPFGSSPTTTTPSSFFERFSSVELLFLISSLMFLVLLVLGLGTSYYCFRRQAHRGSVQRASAILKRRRRYNAPGALLRHDRHGSAGVARPGGGPVLQDYYGQRMAGSGLAVHSLTAPSSPESDLSARGLLGPGAANLSSYRSLHYPSFNQAYLPDTAANNQKHYAAGSYLPAAAYSSMDQLAGRRQGSLQQNSANTTAISTTGAILGRRDATYGRPQRYLSPHSMRRSRQMAQFSATTNGQAATSKVKLNVPEEQASSVTVGSNYKMLHRLPSGVALADLKQQQIGYDENANNLPRAKSLSSVRYLEPTGRRELFSGGTEARGGGGRRRQRLPHERLDEFLASSGRSVSRKTTRPNNHNNSKEYSSDSEMEPNNNSAMNRNRTQHSSAGRQSNKPASILLKSIEDSYITNFTEIYEQEYMKRDSTRPLSMSQWRAMQPQRQGVRKPKGSSDGVGDQSSPDAHQRDSNGSTKTMDAGSDDDATIRGGQSEELDNGPEGQRYHSAHANLRSLTELDVNFARSSLGPSIPALRAAIGNEQHSGDISKPSEQEEASTPSSAAIDDDETRVTPQLEQVSSHQMSLAPQGTSASPEEQMKPADQKKPLSPDLMLSPDYDHDKIDLKPHDNSTTSSSSRNSVSYV